MTLHARRRALVTGATGFVGGAVAEALVRDDWTVHVVVRPTSSPARADRLRAMGCTVLLHDGTASALRTIVATAAPERTWHLATRFVAEHTPDDIASLVRDNVEFGAMLLDALSAEGRGVIVTAGSHWQEYGNVPRTPLSLYAATKIAFDDIAAYYADTHAVRLVRCLLTDTYGPGDPRRKLLAQLVDAARTGVPLAMSGDGAQMIDLLHISDVVRALQVAGDRAAAAGPAAAESWAVRSGSAISVRELVERFGKVYGRTVPVQWNARPPRAREWWTSWSAGHLLPGWTPRVTLEAGLASII